MKKIEQIQLKKNKSKILCLTANSKSFAELIDKYVDITSKPPSTIELE